MSRSHIDPLTLFFDSFCHPLQQSGMFFPVFQIKTDITDPFIRRQLGQKINKHIRLLLFGQRHVIFNFHSFDAKFRQHGADKIFRFCCRLNRKFIPLHAFSLSCHIV